MKLIKEYPPKRASFDVIEAHLQQLEHQNDFKPDLIIIDYLDYMRTRSRKERKEEMLSTGNRIFVEASPLDNIWGIGLAEDTEGIDNPSFWLGLNLLGQALTLVKQEIRTL